MAKTAIVINPYIFDFKLYDEWMHPLGLYFLIEYLQYYGFQTHFINCLERSDAPKRFGTGEFKSVEIEKPDLYRQLKRKYKKYGITAEEFKRRLENVPSPDLICIGSMMTYWLPGVIQTIREIRQVHPTVQILVGGVAAQLFGNYLRENISGISVADKEVQLSEIPFTCRIEQNNFEPSLSAGLKAAEKLPHGPVLSSLGCPLTCHYCASKKLQPSFHRRPVQLVADEIRLASELFQAQDFAFYDDALLVQFQKTIEELVASIGDLIGKIRFHTPNGLHLKYLDSRTLELLTELNVTTLRFGYETSSDRYRHVTNDKANMEMLIEKARLIKTAVNHMNVGIYIMAGLPEQKPEDVLDEMDMVSSLGMQVKPVFISPVPRTPLFSHYVKIWPQIASDPLWHNDLFFITKLPGWGSDEVELVRHRAKELNQALMK